MSLGQCTYEICNEREGGVLACVGTPYESTDVEYLDRQSFDVADIADIVKTTIEISRAVAHPQLEIKMLILLHVCNFVQKSFQSLSGSLRCVTNHLQKKF